MIMLFLITILNDAIEISFRVYRPSIMQFISRQQLFKDDQNRMPIFVNLWCTFSFLHEHACWCCSAVVNRIKTRSFWYSRGHSRPYSRGHEPFPVIFKRPRAIGRYCFEHVLTFELIDLWLLFLQADCIHMPSKQLTTTVKPNCNHCCPSSRCWCYPAVVHCIEEASRHWKVLQCVFICLCCNWKLCFVNLVCSGFLHILHLACFCFPLSNFETLDKLVVVVFTPRTQLKSDWNIAQFTWKARTNPSKTIFVPCNQNVL